MIDNSKIYNWILHICLDKIKCICESENGGPGKNEIMCNISGSFEHFATCSNHQWCTGPATNDSAIIGTVNLCENGGIL